MKKRKAAPSQPESPPVEIPTGIKELVWVDPRTLSPNPLNWKTHPESQRASLRSSLKTNGWAGALLFNETTGKLLDGHGRRDEAIRLGLESVPVLVGEWDEESERRILQSLDTIGSMYSTDTEKLSSLNALVAQDLASLDNLDQETKRTFEAFQTRLEALPEAIESGDLSASPLPLTQLSTRRKDRTAEDAQRELEESLTPASPSHDEEEVESVRQLANENLIFKSSNDWGIPDLLPRMLAGVDCLPDRTYNRHPDSVSETTYYCHSARPFPLREETGVLGGIYGFFTEDWRFEASYFEPGDFAQAIINEQFNAVIAPDFSVYAEWPLAMRLWNLYRSRYVARFWQEAGLKVIPVLHSVLAPGPSGQIDVGLETFPKKCPVVATQCQTISNHGGDFKAFAKWLSNCIETIQPRAVIIYGGGENQGRFLGHLPKQSSSLRYVMLNSFMAARREDISRQKKRTSDG